jgi:hypothetical protein
MDILHENGYLIIPNNKKDLFESKMNLFYRDNNVNYIQLKDFIDTNYFNQLKQYTDFIIEPNYGKFRFSNNNNSSDASLFHGDIYSHQKDDIMNVYTCLYYFDDANFEIVPKSHKRDYRNNTSSTDSFKNRHMLDIKGGTFIIIHANLHHRGVNFNTADNRRLLQIFEVTFTKEEYETYSPNIIIVETYQNTIIKTLTNWSKYMFSKGNHESLTYFHYILMYNDLQYKIPGMGDLPPSEKENRLISYEPGPRVNIANSQNCTDTNVNIICDQNIAHIGPSYYYLYFGLFIILLFCVLLYIGYNYRSILTKTKKTFKSGFVKRK